MKDIQQQHSPSTLRQINYVSPLSSSLLHFKHSLDIVEGLLAVPTLIKRGNTRFAFSNTPFHGGDPINTVGRCIGTGE